MKVLFCHNYYQQTGGEDMSFADELQLLTDRGHDTFTYLRHNDEVYDESRLHVATEAFWSSRTYREVRALIAEHRPDIIHCTNTFPRMSPSIYYAARSAGVPVIHSLRNFRMICANGLLYRQGSVCETCIKKTVTLPAIWHKCYRNSALSSGVVTAMMGTHRKLGTWTRTIDLYVTLTHHARSKFIEAGLPADRIRVKPNFLLTDPLPGPGDGGYAVFAGRLSSEKGIDTLLDAWEHGAAPLPLVIVGDGPMAPRVQAAALRHPDRIKWRGALSRNETLETIGRATCALVPSQWYETFGRTIIEAFAKRVPVVASKLGAMEELVEHNQTGLHFEPGNPDDLLTQVCAIHNNPALRQTLATNARQKFLDRYTAETNYRALIGLYQETIDRHAIRNGRNTPRAPYPLFPELHAQGLAAYASLQQFVNHIAEIV